MPLSSGTVPIGRYICKVYRGVNNKPVLQITYLDNISHVLVTNARMRNDRHVLYIQSVPTLIRIKAQRHLMSTNNGQVAVERLQGRRIEIGWMAPSVTADQRKRCVDDSSHQSPYDLPVVPRCTLGAPWAYRVEEGRP